MLSISATACDADGGLGASQNCRLQRGPLLRREQLGIGYRVTQWRRRAARMEHQCRSDHRPGPWATACLVDAGHAPAGRTF